jgi:hypothetical protein
MKGGEGDAYGSEIRAVAERQKRPELRGASAKIEEKKQF